MLDAKLISACVASREAFERVLPHVTDKDMSPYAGFWYKVIAEWYERDSAAKSIDRDVLVEFGKRKLTNSKSLQPTVEYLVSLADPVSPDNVALAVLELRRHNVGLELAQALAGQDAKSIKKLLPVYEELLEASDLDGRKEWEDAVDWTELDSVVGKDRRIPLAPGRLNERTRGGVLPGHHVLVFGRPEVGKSTFVINMAAGFLWSGQRVLYVGNEDNINVLKARMRNRLSGMTDDEIERNDDARLKADKLAAEKAGDRLLMTYLKKGRISHLEQRIEEFEPTVVIVDQLRGLRVSGDDGMTQKLESLGIEFRSIIGSYNVVGVSVTQANDRSERYGQHPPLFLGMADVDSSRTGLPGTTDLMLGVGIDEDTASKGQRGISIPKNKLSSAPDAHTGFIVQYDTARSKVV